MKDIESTPRLLSEAIVMAVNAHCSQIRRNGTPYIYHPLAVAGKVSDWGYGIEYQIVAVLHDVLEDTQITKEMISAKFGENIAEAVDAVTRKKDEREDDYVNRVLQNPIAVVVKAADKIHNLEEVMSLEDVHFCKHYVKKSETYYYGKLSPLVDNMISKAASMKKTSGGGKGLPLYAHNVKRDDTELKFPPLDINKHGNEYYIYWDRYICIPEAYVDKVIFGKVPGYVLTEDGWKPRKIDMMDGWAEMYEISREEMEEEIGKLQEEGWFHEGVDSSLL